MSNITNILEGWANFAKDKIGHLEPELKELSRKRLEICNDCPIRVGDICAVWKTRTHKTTAKQVRGCGCMLAAKALVKQESCPAGEW